MLRGFLFFILVVFAASGITFAQSDPAIEVQKPTANESITTESNHLSLRIVQLNDLANGVPHHLQLVDEQVSQIRDLYNEYQRVVVEPMQKGTVKPWTSMSPDEKAEFMTAKTAVMRRLNERAMNDILLPHQANFVLQQEFADGLTIFRGDLMAFLLLNGRFVLGIQPEQTARIRERGEAIARRIDEVRKRFEAEMAEIKKDIRSDLHSILSDEQNLQLDGILKAINDKEVKPFGIPASPPRSVTSGRL